jgi:hypothetical protein
MARGQQDDKAMRRVPSADRISVPKLVRRSFSMQPGRVAWLSELFQRNCTPGGSGAQVPLHTR